MYSEILKWRMRDLSPRPYQMRQRQVAAARTRIRILMATRKLLLGRNFSEFTMEAVARAAGVTRLTVYHQFESRAGLLEALYNFIAQRGSMQNLAEVFRRGSDPLQTLHEFIRVFAGFWSSDRAVIRRLHALGAIDAEIGKGLLERNERRRNGLRVILERYGRVYRMFTPVQEPIAIDTLHMLTSFETYDALAGSTRSAEEVVEIIIKLVDQVIGLPSPFIRC
jgi:AcrR family transcriptional regulator